jgi:serine/threonine-protein kinase SRPK3
MSNSHVALKVFTADAIQGPKHIDELRIPQHPGYERIVLLDHFEHKGPYGIHLCLVLELLGPTLCAVQKAYQKRQREIPAPVVKKITKQILQGLDYLHQSC